MARVIVEAARDALRPCANAVDRAFADGQTTGCPYVSARAPPQRQGRPGRDVFDGRWGDRVDMKGPVVAVPRIWGQRKRDRCPWCDRCAGPVTKVGKSGWRAKLFPKPKPTSCTHEQHYACDQVAQPARPPIRELSAWFTRLGCQVPCHLHGVIVGQVPRFDGKNGPDEKHAHRHVGARHRRNVRDALPHASGAVEDGEVPDDTAQTVIGASTDPIGRPTPQARLHRTKGATVPSTPVRAAAPITMPTDHFATASIPMIPDGNHADGDSEIGHERQDWAAPERGWPGDLSIRGHVRTVGETSADYALMGEHRAM